MTWTPDNCHHNAAGYLVRHQKQRERRGKERAMEGRSKINEYQVYLSEDYRINAEGQMVQNIAPKGTRPAIDRFEEKIAISEISFYNDSPCWEWAGCKQPNGYGQFRADGRRGAKKTSPHRFAYEYYVAPIPEGHEVDHLCKNRGCCNPDHLEAIPVQENRIRRNADQTHCKNAHEFTEENTHINTRGQRVCRACAMQRARRYRRKNYKPTGLVKRPRRVTLTEDTS